jgi:two-component system chemotaxis response regulator CheY
MQRNKVLIIDDSAVTRKSLRDFFQKLARFDIYEAESAEEGYIAYRKIIPDIVTMDITMKEMNGVELTRKLMEEYPSAIIIMVSASDQQEMVVQALKFGAKNYIIKPFSEEKLTDMINALV